MEQQQEEEMQKQQNADQEQEANSQQSDHHTHRFFLQNYQNNQSKINNDLTYQNTILSKTKSPQRTQFILDCDNRKKSRLPVYNGLTDKYLTPFFQNPNTRNNLIKAGLINGSNEIIETKKPVILPFRKLDPIVQRKHISHLVNKRKAVSNKHYQQMSQSSTQGSKCFSTSKNKKIYLYEKLPPLKTPKQGSKIHLPEIYLEKNFHQFATQYLEFLENNSIDPNQSLERQFIEKYRTQQRKKIIRHYVPLHTQVRGVKEDCLAWKFQTETNQFSQQQQFCSNKNNFYKQQSPKQEEQLQYDEEFEKEEEKYSDDEFSEQKEKKSEYDEEFDSEADLKKQNDDDDEVEEEKSEKSEEELEEQQEKDNSNNYNNTNNNSVNSKKDDDYDNDFEDDQEQEKQKDQSEYDGNDFEDEEIN